MLFSRSPNGFQLAAAVPRARFERMNAEHLLHDELTARMIREFVTPA